MRIEVLSIKPIGKMLKRFIRKSGDVVVTKNPEYRIVAYYDRILAPSELKIPTINLHPGYLPFNRGVHTHLWPLVDGTPAGVTIHKVNEGVDRGEILVQRQVKVYPTDIASTLQDRIDKAMFKLFTDYWVKIRDGKITLRPQEGRGTYHWRKDAPSIQEFDKKTIDRLRACTFDDRSYAYFVDNGKKICFGIKFFNKHG